MKSIFSDLICPVLPCSSRVPRKHVVETDIHFYHVPTHADASRKRIMEDTEDWRPRTGTTQSRSFKILAQITGTENGTLLTCVKGSDCLCTVIAYSRLFVIVPELVIKHLSTLDTKIHKLNHHTNCS